MILSKKKIVHFFSQFFLESANRAALFDGESASASGASNFGQERERERRSQKVGSAQYSGYYVRAGSAAATDRSAQCSVVIQ